MAKGKQTSVFFTLQFCGSWVASCSRKRIPQTLVPALHPPAERGPRMRPSTRSIECGAAEGCAGHTRDAIEAMSIAAGTKNI